jgi:hypothetical protein
MKRVAAFVAEVFRLDLPHRKGWKPSENPHPLHVIDDLRKEVNELDSALVIRDAWSKFPDLGGDAHAKEEAADVFVCLAQIMLRLDMTMDELEALAIKKIKSRFIGAEEIEVNANA